jgi:putative flippase GtrA
MKQFFNFFLLGAISTLADFFLYSLLIAMGIHYSVAIVFGYSLGLWINYTIGRRHIFTAGTKLTKAPMELAMVVAIALVGMLLNIIIVHLLSFSLWQIDSSISRFIAIGIAFFWNFLARKKFVYH